MQEFAKADGKVQDRDSQGVMVFIRYRTSVQKSFQGHPSTENPIIIWVSYLEKHAKDRERDGTGGGLSYARRFHAACTGSFAWRPSFLLLFLT